MDDEDRKVVDAMTQYGGSFVRALGHAARVADPMNLAKLKAAFPEYWRGYAARSKATGEGA